MDFVSRLTGALRRCAGLVLAVALSAFAVQVIAATCTPRDVTKWKYSFQKRLGGVMDSGLVFDDPHAACSASAGAWSSDASSVTVVYPYTTSYSYTAVGTYNAGNGCTLMTTLIYQQSNDTCSTCTNGYTQQGGPSALTAVGSATVHESCTDDPCKAKQGKAAGAKGQELSMPSVGPSGGIPKTGCDSDNCQIGKPNNAGGIFGKLNNQWTYTDPDASGWSATGSACTANDSPSSAPAPCPAKQCPGTVNGASICVPCDSTSTADSKKTERPDPAASGASAPPATTTETKTTECSGGKCTTTKETTETNGNGTTTTQEKTEQSEQSFCAENPKSDQCAEDEEDTKRFSGTCAATSCEGDAITCAIAKEQAKRNCELLDANDASARGITASTAGDHPSDHPFNSVEDRPLSAFDKTDLLPGGCMGDMSVSIGGGRSVTLPFASLCGPANILGNILVALTALSCIGIVFVRGK